MGEIRTLLGGCGTQSITETVEFANFPDCSVTSVVLTERTAAAAAAKRC